ncbi:MAG: SpoVA/SpoVAEb family sporulation membrane protein [Oscillospiraceae bacterium]|nr:SpoVA/SpoVAEb family sporulation membrane protein [Oscillospiraceae bacterium]
MNMSNEEYGRYAARHMPRSRMGRNMLRAFLVGGAICALGQGLIAVYTALGLDGETAGTACSVTLIFLGVLLTGLEVYDRLAKFAGAGTLVPITGFANAMASPALEFKSEGKITGTAAKMFVIAGPVIVFGVSAGAVCGLLFWLKMLL